jgi:PAS domain S-box-containing protein
MTTAPKKTQISSKTTEDLLRKNEHFIQFYETDDFLLDSSSEFIGAGLDEGHVCIIIATQAHRRYLEERLSAKGLNLPAMRKQGKYIALDAAETLAKFMVDGLPQPERFTEVIGNRIVQAAEGQYQVRLFGEMVTLLWMQGNQMAAIRLEEIWNDLSHTTHLFSLLCAYPMQGFIGETYQEQFVTICQQHTHVVPDESYSLLSSQHERLRTIALLQQKAKSLEAEIAERKVAEERLQCAENHYRRLFEASRDGILLVDPRSCTIIDANPYMTELLGYAREQLQGRELWHVGLFQNQEVSGAVLRDLQEKRFLRYDVLPFQTKNGELRYMEFVSNLYQANGDDIIQCHIRDITEREELNKRKDEFISMASHELKTPITSLKGFLHLLQRQPAVQDNKKALHYLTRMDAQVNKLTMLINDLLDLSKMQTGQLAYREEYFEMDALVQEIVENVQETTQTHRIIFEGYSQAQVFGDRDRIGQVLINLLNNAIKYSPQAKTVVIRTARDHNRLLVSVQDFGIGIAQEFQHKIFERFYQVTDPEEKTYPGLGIGLYISNEIVKRHRGRMWVESEKGKGTIFHIDIPLQENEERLTSL